MATVQFIIRDPKAKGKTSIHLVFYYDQVMIKLSTGETINPKLWNRKQRRARKIKFNDDLDSLNNRLDVIESDILMTFREHLNRNKAVLLNKLRGELKNAIHPQPIIEPQNVSLFKFIGEYIKTNPDNRSHLSLVSYGATKHVLERYSKKMLNTELDFDNIGMDFYNDFQRYCFQVEHKALNTFGGHIKNLKIFMKKANDKGFTDNTNHKHSDFKKLEETSDSIYLSDTELETIFNLDLANNPKLDRVRDLFLIGCQTGLRYSDLSQLTENSITDGGTRLRVKTAKTGERVVIPLHWQVKAIMQKWDGVPPRSISNQKMNEYLKDLGKEAKFTETVSRSITRGGIKVSSNLKKWQLITVHTARRSFATNMFLADVPTISIMKITGHRTEKSFLKYIKISQEQNADKLANHPWFTKSTPLPGPEKTETQHWCLLKNVKNI